MKWIRRVLGWGAALLVVAFVALLFPFNPPKLTPAEITAKVDLLNEKAAIDTPHHDLGKKIREANLALFEKVERGEQLTTEESASYRVLYQSILNQKQHELSLLDHELTLLTNYMPEKPNNVGSMGIEGRHDHHDASAAANLDALRRDLAQLESANGVLGSYTRVRETASDELQRLFEPLMLHFKAAQFEPVNSPAYKSEVHLALDSYDALVVLVQDRVYSRLGPVERSLTGGWGSWRSLTPSLKGLTSNRIGRTTPAP